jgi:predicted DNA-binding transcriptional regulator YafY
MASVDVVTTRTHPSHRDLRPMSIRYSNAVSSRPRFGENVAVADSTARALALLALLQTRRQWSGRELAARLAVSERTVRRDVDRLRELGYSVDAVPGVAGGYRLAVGSELPPLLFDDDEAVALAVALRAVAGGTIEGVEETAVGIMAKLEQMLPDRLRRRVDAVHANVSVLRWAPTTPVVPPAALATLTQACRDNEEVRFEYRRRDGDASRRLVRPHRLVVVGRRWYLVAWDVRRDGWRTFRVDRMGPPDLAGARFPALDPPPGGTEEFVRRSLASAPRTHRARVIVTGPEREVLAVGAHLDAEVEVLPDGRAAVTLATDATVWLASMIAMLATSFDIDVVDAPAEVEQLLAAAGRRLAPT